MYGQYAFGQEEYSVDTTDTYRQQKTERNRSIMFGDSTIFPRASKRTHLSLQAFQQARNSNSLFVCTLFRPVFLVIQWHQTFLQYRVLHVAIYRNLLTFEHTNRVFFSRTPKHVWIASTSWRTKTTAQPRRDRNSGIILYIERKASSKAGGKYERKTR